VGNLKDFDLSTGPARSFSAGYLMRYPLKETDNYASTSCKSFSVKFAPNSADDFNVLYE
jgi:hypothetical protein